MTDLNTLIDRLSDRQRREFALWCAERVRHLMTDTRSTSALDVVARHLRGEATEQELASAWASASASAAWEAAAAASAAWYASRYAASAAGAIAAIRRAKEVKK
jgi:hypothetical protein